MLTNVYKDAIIDKEYRKGVIRMATVRINDNIKKEVTPILDDLGLSLSEAINIFLHQHHFDFLLI